jgi:hypothetical protein
MAYTKVSALTAKTTPAGTEELLINDGGVSKKITQTNLLSTALPKAGGTMTGDVSLGDSVKAKFGASDDLQIYHDGIGGNSYIQDVGTGNLYIDAANNLQLRSATDSALFASFAVGGNSQLYHAGSSKLATTSTGIDVTGTVNGLEINTTATANLGLGTSAVDSITTGDYNVGVGDGALTANTTGYQNTATGYQALTANTTGVKNTASGFQALFSNTTASYNTASGYRALFSNTTASYNTANGSYALYSNTTGANNTASGYKALYSNTTGAYNTATGYEALKSGQSYTAGTFTVGVTFVIAVVGTTDFTLIGASANTVGISFVSTGLGTGTGTATSRNTGSYNTANGFQALTSNAKGSYNTAYGMKALEMVVSAERNTAIGYQALGLTTGSYNTAVGMQAGIQITTGTNNLVLGKDAGDNITTGSSNIIIGSNVDAPSATASNQLNIGGWITGAAGAITVPGSLTTAGFTSTGIDDNATSTAITIDASENVGIGSSIEAHHSTMHSIQHGFGGNLSAWKSNNTVYYLSNSYYGTTWKAINSGAACKYEQKDNGIHEFQVAASVAAEADNSWVTGFEVLNDGKARAKNGLLFGTDTAAANALDDYETGTWTPAWLAGTSDATYNIQVGTYTKIGNKVHAQCRISITSAGTMSGNLTLTGLPFAASSTANNYSGLHCGYGSNLAITAGASVGGYINLSQTAATMKIWSITTGATDFTAAMLSTNGNIMITAEYIV